MGKNEMKLADIFVSPKTTVTLIVAAIVGYGWLFTTFVSASDFTQHVQTYELDRTDDKIDDFEVRIFNLKENIKMPGGDTRTRREQLSKYEGDLRDYRTQLTCLENGRTNCRRKR